MRLVMHTLWLFVSVVTLSKALRDLNNVANVKLQRVPTPQFVTKSYLRVTYYYKSTGVPYVFFSLIIRITIVYYPGLSK